MAAPRRRRLITSFVMVLVSFLAIVVWAFVIPAPGRFYYNLTANGALSFITSILFTMYAAIAWPVIYAALWGLERARTPSWGKARDPSEPES